MLNLSLDSQETSSLLLPSPFLFSPFSSPDTKEGALLLLVSPLLYFINSFYERTNGQTGRGGGGQKRREEKRRPSLYYWKKKRGEGGRFFSLLGPRYWKLTGLTDGVTKAEGRRDVRKKVDMKQPPSRQDHHVELVQRTKCRTRRKLKFIKTSLPFPSSYEISRNYSTPLTIFGDEVRTGGRKKLK